jgi:hypothetical protein
LAEIATAIGTLAPKSNPTLTGTTVADILNVNTLVIATGTTFPAGDVQLTDLAQTAKAFQGALYHIRDERINGAVADDLTDNTWNTRILQTEKSDDLTITLASNQFALPAGTYWCEAEALVYFNVHGGTNAFVGLAAQSRLRNITDGATLAMSLGGFHQVQHQGSSAQGNLEAVLRTTIRGRFVLAGTKTIELQTLPKAQSGSVPSSITGGKPISSGENEIYADVRIWKTG